jgi:hypothetical protein
MKVKMNQPVKIRQPHLPGNSLAGLTEQIEAEGCIEVTGVVVLAFNVEATWSKDDGCAHPEATVRAQGCTTES